MVMGDISYQLIINTCLYSTFGNVSGLKATKTDLKQQFLNIG